MPYEEVLSAVYLINASLGYINVRALCGSRKLDVIYNTQSSSSGGALVPDELWPLFYNLLMIQTISTTPWAQLSRFYQSICVFVTASL
jgi:hypothetical protein